jgi:putative ABC transport system substrate-binding protein
MPDAFLTVQRKLIIGLAALHRIPAIYPYRYQAMEGGLISYGIDTVDLFRRTASYVARILNGEKASDLPVQAPVKFELVLNTTTAKALGLKIPPRLIARADTVIE